MSLFIPSKNEDNECCDDPCELDGPCESCCPCDNLPSQISVYPFYSYDRGTSDPSAITHPDCNDKMYETTSSSIYDGPNGKECAYGGFKYDEKNSTWTGPSNPPSSGCGGLFGVWKDDDGYPTHLVARGLGGSAGTKDGPYDVKTSYCGDQDCEEDPDTCTPPLQSGERRCADDEVPCTDPGGCPDHLTPCIDGIPLCTGDQPCCPPGTPIQGVHNCCKCDPSDIPCDDLYYECCEDGEPRCDDLTHPCCDPSDADCDDYTHPCCGDMALCDDLTHPCCGDTPVCEDTYPCCDGQTLCSSLVGTNVCGSGIVFNPADPCVPCCTETNDCTGPSGCCDETNDCPPDPCCNETNDCPPYPCCSETNDCPPDPCCNETMDCPHKDCCQDSPNCYSNCCDETNDCDPSPCQDKNCCDEDDYPPKPDGCVDCVEQTCQEVCEHYYIDTSL